MKVSALRVVNLVAVIATIAYNAFTQILPLNGQTSADIANRFTDNYFFPANYVFSIWSIIYIGLIAFGIYGVLPKQANNPLLERIGPWFLVSCIANCVWLTFFHFNLYPASMAAMIVLLVSLIAIYLRIRPAGVSISRADLWVVRVTFSVYLGWITVATIANASYVLTDAGWNGFGIDNATWGAIMIVVGGIIAGAFAYLNRDIPYALVIVWAFAGIIARFADANVPAVVISSGVLAALVGAAALFAWYTSRSRGGSTPARRMA
jgi:hypothetical protein